MNEYSYATQQLEELEEVDEDYVPKSPGAPRAVDSHSPRKARTAAKKEQEPSEFVVNDEVVAEWPEDGEYYFARITSVSWSGNERTYLYDVKYKDGDSFKGLVQASIRLKTAADEEDEEDEDEEDGEEEDDEEDEDEDNNDDDDFYDQISDEEI